MVKNFKRFDEEEFRRDLLDIPFSDVKTAASDANELWDIWKNFFLAVLNKHALPTTLRVKGRQLPYLTNEIRQLCRQRDYIKKRAIKTGSIYLWQAFRQLRNKVIYSLRNLRRDYYTRKIEENKGNLKNTWKILKHAIGKETKNVSIDKISKDGKIITDPIDIAECCNDHFAFIGQWGWLPILKTQSSSTHFVEKATVNTKFDFKLINAIEVYNKLKTLDKNKATGIHDIPNIMLLLCADIVAPRLADIFNYSLVSKHFLDDFKIGKVSPLFKNEEREGILITIDPFQSCPR